LANENPQKKLIIVGDFNTTRGLKEKQGGSIVRDEFRKKMDDIISYLDLFDVPPPKVYILGITEAQDQVTLRLGLIIF